MIVYSVLVEVEPSIEAEWREWMKGTHIPEVMATGCFVSHSFREAIAGPRETPTYSIEYQLNTIEDLDHYQKDHATRLKAAHLDQYASGCVATRTVYRIVA